MHVRVSSDFTHLFHSLQKAPLNGANRVPKFKDHTQTELEEGKTKALQEIYMCNPFITKKK